MAQSELNRDITYRCVVGHAVPATALDERTEVVRLDDGAEVRICREHGAPIAMTSRPMHHGKGTDPNATDT